MFTDTVRFYEVNNNGGWYDFGFLLGIRVFLGGGSCCGPCKKRKRHKSLNEQEWEEIGAKVEEKIRDGIKSWVDESEKKVKIGKILVKRSRKKLNGSYVIGLRNKAISHHFFAIFVKYCNII